jgi:hypothetical protein
MAEQIPTQAGPVIDLRTSTAETSSLHVAAGDDAIDLAAREDRLHAILARGDIRDQAAERRDRRADNRPLGGDGQAGLDRDWAGRDRDAAAGDRADLVGLLHAQEGNPNQLPLFVEQD